MQAIRGGAFGRLVRSGLFGGFLLLLAVAAPAQQPAPLEQPPLPASPTL
jgi:hypothetical protein